MTTRSTNTIAAAAIALAVLAGAADAQTIGTFSWQTQPYCNVVTVQVIQQGPLYQLIGSDNLCGAGTAPITGTAVPAGGGVALGMTAALPNGRAAHLSATVSLATISGTWSDADGHTGPFTFNANAGGGARPVPAGATAITVSQFAPTVYAGTGAATTVARSDHDHDARYYTKGQADAITGALLPTSALGPRGLLAQAEVLQSSNTFRYSRMSNGRTMTVSHPAPGFSNVVLPGFTGSPGAVFDQAIQVTSFGSSAVCNVAVRGAIGSDLTVQVYCFNPSTLTAIDTNFAITVTS